MPVEVATGRRRNHARADRGGRHDARAPGGRHRRAQRRPGRRDRVRSRASGSRRARFWSASTTRWSGPRSARREASLREAQLALERAQKLRTNNTVAQATVDELQAAFDGAQARLDGAQKQLADRTVRAPFAGVVGMRRIDVGARVDDETVLTTLDDLAELEVEFSVPEIFFGRMRRGQPVGATSAAFPGRIFQGKVATIDTRVGAISRAFRVRAVIPNPDLVLPAGMFMHVERRARGAAGGADPGAGGARRGRQHLRVQDRRTRSAARRGCGSASATAGAVEVLDGLAAGELVVRDRPAAAARRRRRSTVTRCAAPAPTCRRAADELSDFCIKRPVFAAVLSMLIVVLGVASLLRLPIRELPDVDAADHQREHDLHRRRARDRRYRDHRADRGRDRRHRRRQDHHLDAASAAAPAP